MQQKSQKSQQCQTRQVQKYFPILSNIQTKTALNNKNEIQCKFIIEQIIDINDFQFLNNDKQQNNDTSQNHEIYLQIRGDYLLQIIKKKIQKGSKIFNKDLIISGFHINQNVKFQIKRQYQYQLQPLSNPIGIIFYFSNQLKQDTNNQNQTKIQLITEQNAERIQKFGKILQSKIIVQRNFHKLFKPVRKLGKGANATVIQGIDLRNKQNYALKGFKKSKGYSFQKGIFLKQYQILRQIDHNQIVKVHSVFETQNSLYMVLDKYNQNLYDFLISKGLKSQYQLKAIIKGILQILQYLHNKNIMHRDIKPENIMIRQRQFEKKQLIKIKTKIQPILIDFGFAQFQHNEQFTLYRCGTPGFVAPEILKNYEVTNQLKDSFNSQISISKRKYTKLCDIFSLGCLFHILLTNRMPFTGKTREQLMKNNAIAAINENDKIYKLLDVSAKKLLFRMLEKDPNKRITAKQALNHQFFTLQMFNFKPIQFKSLFGLQNQHQTQVNEIKQHQLLSFQ